MSQEDTAKRVFSAFDGLSGGRIALERAGVEVGDYYSSEVDRYAIEVSKSNWDDITYVGDITQLTEEYLKSLGPIDLLIGGSPCQGFSMAGKKRGSSTKDGIDVVSLEQYLELKEQGFEFDGQSYLFWEYVRIWKILKPKYFFLENVRITKKWLPMFNETMGVEPIFVDSTLVSAQNRPRFYWTNISFEMPEDRGITLDTVLDDTKDIDYVADFKDSVRKNIVGFDLDMSIGRSGFSYAPCTSGWQDHRVGITKSPCLRASSVCTLVRCRSGGVRLATVEEWEKLQTIPVGYTSAVSDRQRYKMLGNGWTIDVIVEFFKNLDKEPIKSNKNIVDTILRNKVFNNQGVRI